MLLDAGPKVTNPSCPSRRLSYSGISSPDDYLSTTKLHLSTLTDRLPVARTIAGLVVLAGDRSRVAPTSHRAGFGREIWKRRVAPRRAWFRVLHQFGD
jgi:hypothetical protein